MNTEQVLSQDIWIKVNGTTYSMDRENAWELVWQIVSALSGTLPISSPEPPEPSDTNK